MNDARSHLTNPSRRLPNLELPAAGDGDSVKIRRGGRTAPVVALLHGADCAECTAYLRQLAERHDDIVDADGRVIAVLSAPPSADDAAEIDAPFPVLLDREGRLASALDVQPPAIVTADQWGAIHAVEAAGAAHDFPRVQDVLASLNYLSVECPECEGEAL